MEPTITVDELAAAPGRFQVYDIRWDLNHPERGRVAHESGHIPGAVFVDLEEDLSGPPGAGGRHPLPDIASFAATLGRLGVTRESRVVVYDDAGGRVAARLWWMLRSIGHDAVRVLDGGYQAWVVSGHDVGVGRVTPEPAPPYPVPGEFAGVVTRQQLGGRALIDARSEERYRGDIEPVDPKAGHIPGAINIPTSRNLTEDSRFRPADELASLYAEVPRGAVVSCGSGVTACHDALAMVLAGREMPAVYVGSFSEWSRLDLPVATGANP